MAVGTEEWTEGANFNFCAYFRFLQNKEWMKSNRKDFFALKEIEIRTRGRRPPLYLPVVAGVNVEALGLYGFVIRAQDAGDGCFAAELEVVGHDGAYAAGAYDEDVGSHDVGKNDVCVCHKADRK